jgi:hypothetical protein
LELFGMTTSISNASSVPALPEENRAVQSVKPATSEQAKRRHTLASRLAFLTICAAIEVTTLAYGTVHYWALALFALSAAGIVCLWCVDGLVLRSVQFNLNPLIVPVCRYLPRGHYRSIPIRLNWYWCSSPVC